MQLVINAGSSSLKFALFSAFSTDHLLAEGMFDRFGGACVFSLLDTEEHVSVQDHGQAVQFLLGKLVDAGLAEPAKISSVLHRVVHGGEFFDGPVLVDDEVTARIEELASLAPLHNPANLQGIRACQQALPHAVQVAIFDTAFHQTIAKEAFLYALPKRLYKRFGIRKYGFHGTSHAYIARQLRGIYGKNVDAMSCHLGSGSSITALCNGHSVDTTMGFTPLDGLIMSTRSGGLDPEIPLFLQRQMGLSAEQVDHLLSEESGLRGLTGDADLRKVYLHARQGDEDAKLAIDMLAYRIAWYLNALRTAVREPRAIVFTAGIGERAWYVREKVCDLLGVPLDEHANKANNRKISAASSDVDVWVIPTDEQLEMHLQAKRVLHGKA